MHHKLLILLLLLTHFIQADAQSFFEPGIIVTNSGDTIKGFIADEKHTKLNNEVYFKKNNKSKPQRYSPNDLQSFFISPNQYFESHAVAQRNKKAGEYTFDKHFVYLVESGYISVYKLNDIEGAAYLLKKEGDANIYPLFMTVRMLYAQNAQSIDTITAFNMYTPPAGKINFGNEYLTTFAQLFNDWRKYKPHDFKLTEGSITSEVKNYNNNAHPRFVQKKLFLYQKTKTTWAIGVSVFMPLSAEKQLKNSIDNVTSFKVNSNPIWGYQFSIAWFGQNQRKGLSIEAGFAKLSNVNYNYAYKNGNVLIPVSFQVQTDFTRQNGFLRVNYATNSSKKLSVYGSLGVSNPVVKGNVFIKQVGTTITYNSTAPTFTVSKIEPFTAVGLQYALTREHLFKLEFDYAFPPKARTFDAFVRLGYQYRFSF
jgi:hypothetical protein